MSDGGLSMPAVGESLLTLSSITKSYGEVKAVAGVDLDITRGSIHGFLGPNGAGKTTTIRCIMNIILPDSGEILIGGQPLGTKVRDRIGYLPEERGLYRKMKCRDQLAYLAQLKGVARGESLRRADKWLDRMGLSEWGDRKVDTLSKGMQQKIQFAAVFIFEPDLVILDEVFSGLDPLNIELLREMILQEKEKGTTIIFSTHMLAEAEKICDSICLIEGGEVIVNGSLDEVRAGFPMRSVHVAWEGDVQPPEHLPGVTNQEFVQGVWHLMMADGADSGKLLSVLSEAGPLTLFSANRPSLSEIFLEAVERHRTEVRS
ncbi:MAG: ATP-binding cassette domain-containing protein [Gemmatimonadales bacterium]|nr:ATP-binding cassette domain-containing protein [Gemmatimonadales bacterium]